LAWASKALFVQPTTYDVLCIWDYRHVPPCPAKISKSCVHIWAGKRQTSTEGKMTFLPSIPIIYLLHNKLPQKLVVLNNKWKIYAMILWGRKQKKLRISHESLFYSLQSLSTWLSWVSLQHSLFRVIRFLYDGPGLQKERKVPGVIRLSLEVL
jgi:hypothetical protein